MDSQVTVQTPVWLRAKGVMAMFGLGRAAVNRLVAAGKVDARRSDGVVIYRFSDIAAACDELPRYE